MKIKNMQNYNSAPTWIQLQQHVCLCRDGAKSVSVD